MRPEPCDFNGLSAFFDPASVAAAVRDAADGLPSESCAGGSGIMGQAFITQTANLMRHGTYETPMIDVQDIEDDLTRGLEVF